MSANLASHNAVSRLKESYGNGGRNMATSQANSTLVERMTEAGANFLGSLSSEQKKKRASNIWMERDYFGTTHQ